MTMRIRSAAASTVAILLSLAAPALAQHNLKIVVPYPPASGPDILSRLMGDQIGHAQNTTVVIENRPGGGTTIGTEAVARADARRQHRAAGGELLRGQSGAQEGNYTVAGSFEPICQLASTPIVLVVKADSPYKTIGDFIAAAKAKPGELAVAGAPSSSLQIAYEVLKRGANINLTYVPFGGTAPAVNTLMGGHVAMASGDYPTLVGHFKSGTLRPLLTASAKRVPEMPDVPTYAEAGLGKYEDEIFYGYMAPAKTPAAPIKQLADWFTAAMNAAETKPKLAQQGLFTSIRCGGDFGSYLGALVDNYGRVVREANIIAQ